MQAIVTGASGFVGRVLCAALPDAQRTLSQGSVGWEQAIGAAPLAGATIFHLAARVHEQGEPDAAAFEHDNVQKTRLLAEQAVRQRARRIVFMSTVKVNGEETGLTPFAPGDAPDPQDAYARSKLEAERVLAGIAGASGVEWVVVRSPLVFGSAAKANLESILRLADTPWPLPFAAIDNRRSFIHASDLARILLACGEHAGAPGRTFLAAHPEPFSTPQLVASLRRSLGRPERLFAVSRGLLEAAGRVAGQHERVRRLTRSLEVDGSLASESLGWKAAIGLEDAAAEMARSWRSTHP
jgi:nucleoside-diphosphate-sugar epimerase